MENTASSVPDERAAWYIKLEYKAGAWVWGACLVFVFFHEPSLLCVSVLWMRAAPRSPKQSQDPACCRQAGAGEAVSAPSVHRHTGGQM